MPRIITYTVNGFKHHAVDRTWLLSTLEDRISRNNERIDDMYASYPETDFVEGSAIEAEVNAIVSENQWLKELRERIESYELETELVGNITEETHDFDEFL